MKQHENGEKYVTYKWLVAVFATIAIGLIGQGLSVHSIVMRDLNKQMEKKVEKDVFAKYMEDICHDIDEIKKTATETRNDIRIMRESQLTNKNRILDHTRDEGWSKR